MHQKNVWWLQTHPKPPHCSVSPNVPTKTVTDGSQTQVKIEKKSDYRSPKTKRDALLQMCKFSLIPLMYSLQVQLHACSVTVYSTSAALHCFPCPGVCTYTAGTSFGRWRIRHEDWRPRGPTGMSERQEEVDEKNMHQQLTPRRQWHVLQTSINESLIWRRIIEGCAFTWQQMLFTPPPPFFFFG